MRIKSKNGSVLTGLIILVSFLGVLSVMVTSQCEKADLRYKQHEAKRTLRQIYNEEQKYKKEHGTYYCDTLCASKDNPNAFSKLGITLTKDAIYEYRIQCSQYGSFMVSAYANLDKDLLPDIWHIDEEGNIGFCSNDVTDETN